MNFPNSIIELSIPSRIGYEKIAMATAGSIARTMGFSVDRIEDLGTAVAEACINAIEHGNKGQEKQKVFLLMKADPEKLEVSVTDSGRLSETPKVGRPSIEEKIKPGVEKRGWGMFLIKNLVDEMDMNIQPGNGLKLRMVIYMKKQGQNGQ